MNTEPETSFKKKTTTPYLRLVRLLSLVFAVALVAAACGSAAGTVTEPAADAVVADEGEAMEDEAMEDEAMEDEAMEDDSMDYGGDEDDAMEDEAIEDGAMEDDSTGYGGDEEEAMEDESIDYAGDANLGATGPACSAVPAEGEGSFAGMADDPAATAASNNPLLSTLVTAVGVAGLGDTLNSDGPFTIFAPTNDAFAAIDPATLDAVLADTELLTSVLTFHVVPGSFSSAELIEAGTVTTVNGADVTLEAAGDEFTVNGATVLCQDVPTANATVHIIDTVLVPG